jgi:Cft2 family RNA processing exonuclease
LHVDNLSVLLECPLDAHTHAFPLARSISWKSIDVVLLSNYETCLGLPYLTEYTDFEGVVLATKPTIEFAR